MLRETAVRAEGTRPSRPITCLCTRTVTDGPKSAGNLPWELSQRVGRPGMATHAPPVHVVSPCGLAVQAGDGDYRAGQVKRIAVWRASRDRDDAVAGTAQPRVIGFPVLKLIVAERLEGGSGCVQAWHLSTCRLVRGERLAPRAINRPGAHQKFL